MTILAMATSTAKSGQMEALVAAAKEHAAALRPQPGCLGTYVLRERGSDLQVSISMFESDADLEAALRATRPVIERHHVEALTEGGSRFQVFDMC